MAATKCTKHLRRSVNFFLENSSPTEQRERYAVANLLESVTLHLNDYHGFTYLSSAKVNYDAIQGGAEFHAEDESRRFYHGPTTN